jgi:hypothetical protein
MRDGLPKEDAAAKLPEGPFSKNSSEFHLQEYIALRAEVLALLETLRSLERNVVVAVGITWGFLIERGKLAPQWSWFIPVFFGILGAWRVRGILHEFGKFRDYIAELEEAYYSEKGPIGWQGFSRLEQSAFSERKQSAFSKLKRSDGTVAFWTTLLITTIAVGIYGAFILKR